MILTPESPFHKAVAVFPRVAVDQAAVIIINMIVLTTLGLHRGVAGFLYL